MINNKQGLLLLGAVITINALIIRLFYNYVIVMLTVTSMQIGMGLGFMYGLLLYMKVENNARKKTM